MGVVLITLTKNLRVFRPDMYTPRIPNSHVGFPVTCCRNWTWFHASRAPIQDLLFFLLLLFYINNAYLFSGNVGFKPLSLLWISPYSQEPRTVYYMQHRGELWLCSFKLALANILLCKCPPVSCQTTTQQLR